MLSAPSGRQGTDKAAQVRIQVQVHIRGSHAESVEAVQAMQQYTQTSALPRGGGKTNPYFTTAHARKLVAHLQENRSTAELDPFYIRQYTNLTPTLVPPRSACIRGSIPVHKVVTLTWCPTPNRAPMPSQSLWSHPSWFYCCLWQLQANM